MTSPNTYANKELIALQIMYPKTNTGLLLISKEDMIKILEMAYIDGAINRRV